MYNRVRQIWWKFRNCKYLNAVLYCSWNLRSKYKIRLFVTLKVQSREINVLVFWGFLDRKNYFIIPVEGIQLFLSTFSCLISGLGTAFFSVQNVPFFSVLLKNATFFPILFSSFWQLMRPKRTFRSFLKNEKNRKERNVLLQRT